MSQADLILHGDINHLVGTTQTVLEKPSRAQKLWLKCNVAGNVRVGKWEDHIFVDGDVDVANDSINEVDHGLFTGQGPVQLTSTGTLPAGLALATDYWVIKVDDDNYKLAADRADALANVPVTITAAASGGNHTFGGAAGVSATLLPAASQLLIGSIPLDPAITYQMGAPKFITAKMYGATDTLTYWWT